MPHSRTRPRTVGRGMSIEEVPSATVRSQLDELRARVRHAQLAADVGRALTSTDLLPIQLWHCATAIVEHLDVAIARIWVLDEPEQLLVPAPTSTTKSERPTWSERPSGCATSSCPPPPTT